MPGVDRRAFFLSRTQRYVRHSFIIFVDRIFTSFVERAFTSIFDAQREIAAIACVYHRRHAD
jgi:hypothetical protein